MVSLPLMAKFFYVQSCMNAWAKMGHMIHNTVIRSYKICYDQFLAKFEVRIFIRYDNKKAMLNI